MNRVYTAKDIEELKRNGGTLPADAILTPQAKEVLSGGDIPFAPKAAANAAPARKEYKIPEKEYKWVHGQDPKTPEEIEKFFRSPEIEKLKRLIVDLGRRSYSKNYNDGNGGNFSVRVGDNIVLCTPTMISKGSMTPEDMCFVDMDGNQLAGNRKRTSEVLAHLAIMKRQRRSRLREKLRRDASTPKPKSLSDRSAWLTTVPPERSIWRTPSANRALTTTAYLWSTTAL